jgi:riboflavin biosynthesis pyrimidine reductase
LTLAVRQIYPAQGPELPVLPQPATGPPPAAVTALASLYRHEAGPDAGAGPTRGHWLRANMVASTDGAAAVGGRSGGLSGPADRMLFTVLRSLADVILVGAATARTERYRPVRPAGLWAGLRAPDAPVPAIAIVSGSLNLDPDGPLFTAAAAAAQTIVITTAAAPADRRAAIERQARIIVAGRVRLDFTAAVRALADLGYTSILTEGGPALLGHLVAAGLLDELCLTMSPVLASGPSGRIIAGSPTAGGSGGSSPQASTAAAESRLALAHVLTDDGYLFCRYLREH